MRPQSPYPHRSFRHHQLSHLHPQSHRQRLCQQARQVGMDDYVTKPISLNDLKRVLRLHLQRSKQQKRKIIRLRG